MNAALLRYRVMAYIVGVGLFLVVFVGIPLQIEGMPEFVNVVGTIHGILYMIYLAAAVDLGRRCRFTLPQMFAVVGAGFLPFLAFIIEHRTTKRIRRDYLGERESAEPATATP